MRAEDVVVVAGQGILAEAIALALAEVVTVRRSGAGELLVDVSDAWERADPAEPLAALPSPRLPVGVEIGQVLIGPLERSPVQGCAVCLELRRRRARENPARQDALLRQHGDELRARPSGWLSGLAGATVGALVARECLLLGESVTGPITASAVLVVDLDSLAVDRHTFLPDPLCPRCGVLPKDSPELAGITLAASPKLGPGTYRGRDLAAEAGELAEMFVDPYCGMVRSVVSGTFGGMPVSIADCRIRPHEGSEPGYGRASTFQGARLTALLEALERFGGAEPGGRSQVVVSSYAEVAEHAVDPRSFGLHPAESYEQPDSSFQPFDQSAPTRWVWGYSFGHGRPVLVPEGAAYWHTHPERRLRPFFYEISNGCALGSSLEEAALHGLLEVIERDAFLMTWYARLAAPRIDLRGARREIRLLSSVISADTGCDVLAFDTTMEHGVPSVWVMAVRPENHFKTAKVICSAAAHLDPEHALMSALSELGPARASLDESFAGESARARQLLHDPDQVRTMTDHSLLYGAHEAFERLEFLTGSAGTRGVEEMTASAAERWRGDDLTEDLRDVIDRLAVAGMDVIVVDQTTPEHRAAGLHCVKVLAPGSLSMTFGHQNRRNEGIRRLDEALKRSGGRLNPHPHPFP